MLQAALVSVQAEDVKLFLEQAQLATANLVQAVCMNKARVCRRLRTRLKDYSNLYNHATNADTCPEMTVYLDTSKWLWPENSGMRFASGPCSVCASQTVFLSCCPDHACIHEQCLLTCLPVREMQQHAIQIITIGVILQSQSVLST